MRIIDKEKRAGLPKMESCSDTIHSVNYLITWIQPSGASMWPIWMPVNVS